MQDINFNSLHNHQWRKSIKDKKNLWQYSIYWKKMIEKIKIICDLLLSNTDKSMEPSMLEVARLNKLFKEDTKSLLKNLRINCLIKECVSARIRENHQIIRCAMIMRNVQDKYGLKALHDIICKNRQEFLKRFEDKTKKYIKLKSSSMEADHYIRKIIRGCRLEMRFYSCPILGIFDHLNLKRVNKEFCILCQFHGKQSLQKHLPYKAKIYALKMLTKDNNYCEVVIKVKPKHSYCLAELALSR